MPAHGTHPAAFDLKERILADTSSRAAGMAAALPPRARRELMLLVVLLACGLFVIPFLIWAVGQGVLGPYTDGGPFALLVDFFNGLKSGSRVYWIVAIGPYVLVMVVRALWHLARLTDRDPA